MKYPHIRGEHLLSCHFCKSLLGSPPHTRGTQHQFITPSLSAGITPAYAGNTPCDDILNLIIWDHPRIRGEHFFTDFSDDLVSGSPPHTRGTPISSTSFLVILRITPAYAGNTCGCASIQAKQRDHPRIRGEHSFLLLNCFVLPGSPPHTRGTLSGLYIMLLTARITPAYAGNTA